MPSLQLARYAELLQVTAQWRAVAAEAILKLYNSYNATHPTYKARAEVGKAEKSIFLCDYLRSREAQQEVHEGLNVVAVFLQRWRAPPGACVSDDHGGCGPPACGGVFDQQ